MTENKITYWVIFRQGSGLEDFELNEERGKKLGDAWYKDKNAVFEIDGSWYDGKQIINIKKTSQIML